MIVQTVSHFRILEKLGQGGMGVVYKAEDTRLNRPVALKLLPPDKLADPSNRHRFVQEAKAASALNHPHIITIHDIDEADGVHFIAMEYVDGKTLGQLIPRHGMRLNDALKIAAQIADALAAAHAAGIIHRDLKPTNIMVTDKGQVKVLDFGLAKLTETRPTPADAATLTALPQTQEGVVMGTCVYMSPEQAEGKTVDARSDIFSFGSVLYEMLAGRRAFEGDSTVATLAAVLHLEPKPIDNLPPELEKVIGRCLRKDPGRRFQSMADVQVALEELKEESDSGKLAPAVRSRIPRAGSKRRTPLLVAVGLAAVLIVLAGIWKGGWFRHRTDGRSGPVPIRAVAVLPFVNISGEQDNEYISDGLSEELLNVLAKIPDLRVAARSSAFAFKGKDIDIREVGKKLNVGAILEGSVRKSGERLRITAQLVNVEDGYHIWSGQFDKEMKDIFDIQEEISLTIADHLKLELLKDEKEKILKRATEDHEAYDYYLKGRYFWYRRQEKDFQRGLQYFEQAIGKDPGYALPHVGIADTFNLFGIWEFMPPHQAYLRAKEEANRALEIDPELAEAHASLGWISTFYDWDWPAAEEHFLKAIQKKPEYALAHHWYGNYLSCRGRFDEAVREMQKACELEPLEPVNPSHLGLALYQARRFDESIEVLRKVIGSDPELWVAYWYQAMNFMAKKMWPEAIATLQILVELTSGSVLSLSLLGSAYGSAGMKDEALKILERLDGLSKDRYVGSLWRSWVWIGLGEKNKALENLGKAYLERESLMAFIKVAPLMDSLRSEPRFNDLLKKMNLDK